MQAQATPSDASVPASKKHCAVATEVLQVKKLSDKAVLPTRGSAGAAGYDLSRCAAANHRVLACAVHHGEYVHLCRCEA